MSAYNNRSLFSDYYLENQVSRDDHWQALKKEASAYRERIAGILETAGRGIDGDTP